MKKIALVVILLFISGCVQTNLNKAQTGAAGGAAAGAIIGQAIGKNTGGTLVGAAVGTLLGYIIGNELDKQDKEKILETYNTGLTGKPVAWTNPDTGNKFEMVPKSPYRANNEICRQARINAVIDGKKEVINSTACRDQSGRWKIKS